LSQFSPSEKVTYETQKREINRFFHTAIQYIRQESRTQISSVRTSFEENTENSEITHQLETYQKSIHEIQNSLRDIQANLNQSTSWNMNLIDRWNGFLGNETVFSIYEHTFYQIQSQAWNVSKNLEQMNRNSFSSSQQEIYSQCVKDIHEILTLKLERTEFVQMLQNEIQAFPQTLAYTAHGIQWLWIWVYEWTKALITSTADLLVFLGKYSFSMEYREKIHEQGEKYMTFSILKEWVE